MLSRTEMDARDEKIVKRYLAGRDSMEAIGDDNDITRERVRQILKKHGVLGSDLIERHAIERAVDKASARANRVALAKQKALDNDWRCPVCGGLNVRRGMYHGVTCCSAECSYLYPILRPRIARASWSKQQAEAMLRRQERGGNVKPFQLSHAKRVLSGKNVVHPERFYYNEDSKAGKAYERMLELRRELGTEKDRTWQ